MMRPVFLAAISLSVLTGCGNDRQQSVFDDLRATVASTRQAGAAEMPDPREMAKVAMTQMSEPVILAVLEDRSAVALMVPYGENRGVRTWTTIDKQTVALDGGRIVATRGLGFDLMSLEGSRRPVPGQSRRRVNTINAANENVSIDVTCDVGSPIGETITLMSGQTMPAARFTEDCRGGEHSFQNLFWVTRDGSVRQSRQWIGPGAGYLTLQTLRPAP